MDNIIKFEDYHFEVAEEDLGLFSWDEAKDLESGGWELPTVDELRLMHLCRKRLDMGTEHYWSCAETNNYFAWLVDFISGDTFFLNKDYPGRVRLIKRLSLEDLKHEKQIQNLGHYISSDHVQADYQKLMNCPDDEISAWDIVTPWDALENEPWTVGELIELIEN
jgi:hypothetical protein